MSPELLTEAVTMWPFRRVRRRTQHYAQPLGKISTLHVTWRHRYDEDGFPLHETAEVTR